jgi:hypothetical protein
MAAVPARMMRMARTQAKMGRSMKKRGTAWPWIAWAFQTRRTSSFQPTACLYNAVYYSSMRVQRLSIIFDVVWDVAANGAQKLRRQLEKILAEETNRA